MKTKMRNILLLIVTACIGMSLFVGCTAPSDETADEAAQDREYMSQVNALMDDLNGGLAEFSTAVSNDDLVGMRTYSEKAYKAIDELEKIEAPEALSEVHKEYLAGCEALKKALDGYITLYTDIDTATEGQPYDFEGYSDDLAKIKDNYNTGIDHLEKADNLASEIE